MTIRPEQAATLILGAIMEMSDHAERMGGATSIAGVAALHKMQTSLRKNRTRVIALLQAQADAE